MNRIDAQPPGSAGAPAHVEARASIDKVDQLIRALESARTARGLSKAELARRSEMPAAAVRRLLTSEDSNPTIATVLGMLRPMGLGLQIVARAGTAGRKGRRPASGPARGEPAPMGRGENADTKAKGRGGQARPPSRARKRVRFLCLICAETLLEGMSEAESREHLAQYRTLTERLWKRGQLVACNRLLPAGTAATVRVRGGKVTVTDGPFSEAKELIGGYFLIEARDRAEALRIAARIPGASIGAVEVRPIADDAATLRALGLSVG